MLRPETLERMRVASIALDDAVADLHADEASDPDVSELRDLAHDLDRLWREADHRIWQHRVTQVVDRELGRGRTGE